EFLVSGIFEIDWQKFFMSTDGGYMATNPFNCDIANTKLTCLLIPVQRDLDFMPALNNFNSIISNIKALEKLIPLKRGNSSLSCVHDIDGQICIWLSHSLFIKKVDEHDPDSTAEHGNAHSLSILYMVANLQLTECATAEWPVPERTWTAFEQAALTHNVVPLPAFDKDRTLIAPTNYQKKLCGVVVNVHFRLIHYFIQQEKKSVFTTIVCEIFILRPPPALPINPLKCGCLADGPSFGPLVLEKRFRIVSPLYASSLNQQSDGTICSNHWWKTRYSGQSKGIGSRWGEECANSGRR
ncbi:hypothetical protein SCLCIDRAFT_122155, partial [Scleroderma citrinum Foug A]